MYPNRGWPYDHKFFNPSLALTFSAKVQHACLFKNLKTGLLVSLGQLCDDNYIEILTCYNVKIIKNNKVIITGSRNTMGLWGFPVPSRKTKSATPPLSNPTSPSPSITSLNKEVENGVLWFDNEAIFRLVPCSHMIQTSYIHLHTRHQ